MTELVPQRIPGTIDAVSKVFGVSKDMMTGLNRSRHIVRARQAVICLLREKRDGQKKLTLQKIGIALGGRDHTTIINASEKIPIILESDLEFKNKVAIARGLVENLMGAK